jgi:CHAT domain-containing protein/tetratricopeptide (TPR) repeat protein
VDREAEESVPGGAQAAEAGALDRLDPALAAALTNLASATEHLGDLDTAEAQLRDVIRLWRAAEDPRAAFALHNLGMLRFRAGQLEAAEHFCGAALEEIRGTYGARSVEAAMCVADAAKVFAQVSQYEVALEMATDALKIRREQLPDGHPELIDSLESVGVLFVDSGEPGKALPLLRDAYLGRVALFGEHDPQSVECHCEVLHAARLARDDPEAAQLAREGLAAAVATVQERPGTFAMAQTFRVVVDFACLLWSDGEQETGRVLRDFASRMLEALGELDPRLGTYLDDLAVLFDATGDRLKMLEMRERAFRLHDHWRRVILVTLGESRRDALAHGLSVSTCRYLRHVLTTAPEDGHAVRAALDLLLQRKSIATEAALANQPARRAQGRPELQPLVEQIETLQTRIDERITEGPTDGHRKLFYELDDLRGQLRSATSRLAAELGRLEPPWQDASRAAVAASLPADSALIEFQALWEPSLQDELTPGMVDRQAERYVAFVLRSGDPDNVQLIDLGPGDEVERGVYAYLVAIDPAERDTIPSAQSGVRRVREPEAGAALRRLIFDPLRAALDGRTRLLISPDGAIARVPFAALPEEQEARLIDAYTISYLRTGRSVTALARSAGSEAAAPVVFGDPDYDWLEQPADDDSSFSFARLEGSRVEATSVHDLIGGECVTDREVTQARLAACHSPVVLHLATHGFFIRRRGRGLDIIGNWREFGGAEFRGDVLATAAAEHPLARSGIVLAGVNAWSADRALPADVGDGILSAAEVARIDLAATELVTLSACETALGDLTVGEGAAPLVQAFHAAGARSVIATLWEVPDEDTGALVVDFYTRLRAQQGRADALREAQLALKQRALERGENDPWSWGAFVAYGDWRPVAL